MKPLKVVAELLTGQVATTDGYLPLDGILAAAWMMRHWPDHFFNAGILTEEEFIAPELPLERREVAGAWFWACSFAQADWQGEVTRFWHKRFNVAEASTYGDGSIRRIDTGSGLYRGYRVPLNVRLADRLVWYCVGDPEAISDLLTEIVAVGKKTSQGYGQLNGWTVTSWLHDWSVYGPGGELMRAIPDLDGERTWGVRPPYWYRGNQVRCRMP